jgi:hypothetical protein
MRGEVGKARQKGTKARGRGHSLRQQSAMSTPTTISVMGPASGPAGGWVGWAAGSGIGRRVNLR